MDVYSKSKHLTWGLNVAGFAAVSLLDDIQYSQSKKQIQIREVHD
jgi:hypothetical protein